MSIPGSVNPLFLGAAGQATGEDGYQIERSLRFNSPDSAYLSRTPASAGNRRTWTWAGWVKRSGLNTLQEIFGAGVSGVADDGIGFEADNTLRFYTYRGSLTSNYITTQVFRDASAWYHIVWDWDSANATAADRSVVYVNGSRVTTFSTSAAPSSSLDSDINNAVGHSIGREFNTGSSYFSGYLADIHFIDGQALTPSSFTEVSATTGQLVPIEYTGTYGTNGFHLDFADNASTTTIGYDAAGSNDWTANNLSVTAGAGNDSLVDTPTSYGTDTGIGGEVRGNYCTWNPLWNKDGATLSNGNLDYTTTTSTALRPVYGSIPVSSGKWYWEITRQCTKGVFVGIMSTADNYITAIGPGYTANSYAYYAAGTKWNNSAGVAYGAGFDDGDVIGVALDLDNGRIFFSKNGTWQASGNPATGANPAFSSLSGTFVAALSEDGQSGSSTGMVANFGQRPFAYTAPSGFKALCDTNLPAPVVAKPSTVMDVKLYTGNGSTQTINGLGFSPNLVWIKGRSGATDHALYDTVRGVQQQLESNTTTDETTESTGLTAFNSDGFALGALAQANTSSATYAAWCWDESVSAGFDIVTYTGNGSARTISHSLGVVPNMIIVKARTTASTDQGWPVYHSANTAAPATDYLLLNSTAATADLDTVWNDTAPTSSVFSVGTNALVNTNNDTYVAYCFAPVAGYSSFGSYVGNGTAGDGPFIYTGFRPRWVMVKLSSGAGGSWLIYDAARSSENVANDILIANLSNAEFGNDTQNTMDIVSNGFKLRSSGDIGNTNSNGATYIYAAFAENPFQYARAR